MEVVYRCMDRIILKNDNGELSLNHLFAFEDNIDEILVRTQIVDDKLKRGWIGDLTYETSPAVDIKDGEINGFGAKDTFHDVLLASVKIWDSDVDSTITWEYRFLKK
jgi:hypothetical protein